MRLAVEESHTLVKAKRGHVDGNIQSLQMAPATELKAKKTQRKATEKKVVQNVGVLD